MLESQIVKRLTELRCLKHCDPERLYHFVFGVFTHRCWLAT